mgnify:CR=1 FL=1
MTYATLGASPTFMVPFKALKAKYPFFCYGEGAKTYRDLYPDEEGTLLMPSPDKSVIGVTPAIVGSVEANEVLKLICGYGEPLAGKLWTIDLRTMQSYILSL